MKEKKMAKMINKYARLIILQGLPASGKSTKAKEMVKPGRSVRVNRDLLREMLHFGEYSKKNEREILSAEISLISHFLTSGYKVIVDDTNMSPRAIDTWYKLAKGVGINIEFIKFDTPLAECIKRDSLREHPVGEEAIRQMADYYGIK